MGASRHALVVGGTGMLRGASLQLTRDGWLVSLIARSRDDLDAMARMAARDAKGDRGTVNPIPLDYRDSAALRAAVESAIATHGPISLVLAWIHSTAPDAPSLIAETITPSATASKPFRFIHVLGSELNDPRQGKPPQQQWMKRIPHMRYQRVILGFVLGGGGGGGRDGVSRWLTDDEICAGVWHAIENDDEHESIVGVLAPWERHP